MKKNVRVEDSLNDSDRGKNRGNRRKTCPSATLSTTNPTPKGLGSTSGLRGYPELTACAMALCTDIELSLIQVNLP